MLNTSGEFMSETISLHKQKKKYTRSHAQPQIGGGSNFNNESQIIHYK